MKTYVEFARYKCILLLLLCECCPHCGPRKQRCDFCCDVGSLLLCTLSYLYSLGSKIPGPLCLSVDREQYKYSVKTKNKNKTGTCVEGRGVGDTYITGGHIGVDTHITSDMCTGIHISRGYTYHCDTCPYGGPQVHSEFQTTLQIVNTLPILITHSEF